ncbi:MAG: mechanosensitive ion channel domain-containing protein [Candidatus Rifleibacteriota bacterium]
MLLRYALSVFLLIIFSITPILGENASETAMASEAEKVEEKFSLESPRETVRKFMKIMNEVEKGNLEEFDMTFKMLHLDEMEPEERELKRVELANQLYQILNYFTFKVDAIPEKLAEKTFKLPVGNDLGIDIVLYHYDDGNWRFNYSQTLSKLPEYIKKIEASKADTEAEDILIDPILKSPRDTMNYFFTAMKNIQKDGAEPAVRALDMSRFEKALREDIGLERIAMLKFVIDRYKYVDLVGLPNDTQGPPYVFLTHPAGRIIIERVKQPDTNIEAWKFSAQTVEDLPELYDAFKDKPLISGVETHVNIPLAVRVRDYMKTNFPSLLKRSLLLENWQWLGIFIIVFIGLGFSNLLVSFLQRTIAAIFKRHSLKINLDTENRFLKPAGIAFATWAWWIGLSLLSLPAGARLILIVTVKVITAVASIWAAYRLMDVVGNYLRAKAELTPNKFDDLLVPLITRSLKTLAIAIGLVFIADIFALDIDKILAGLGIGGLAFALAAKDTIANIFGSLTILIDRPFQIGDWVQIGSADGSVESVGVRSTRIRTFYNSLITIPNSQLINATIDNYGARQYRRISCVIGIAYDTPPEKIDAFCEAIRELIRKHPYTRKDYYHVYLNEFANSSLGILLYSFVKAPDWSTELREKHRLFNDIIRVAKELKIEFAFPTQTVYLRNEETPKHKNIPANELEAFNEGKGIADKIVFENLGNPPVKPPPVVMD